MAKKLIVNADDCNLTSQVTQAILECHADGIVTSTSYLVNLESDPLWVREIRKCNHLGVGVHLNLTLGKPLCLRSQIPTLVAKDEKFFSKERLMAKLPDENQVRQEWVKQVHHFIKMFGSNPTHLDTHHQLHEHPLFFGCLVGIAREYGIPVRRPFRLLDTADPPVPMADRLYGDLNPQKHWTQEHLSEALRKLPEGLSEIMCHPGYVDEALLKISSFTEGRRVEAQALKEGEIRELILKEKIELCHYGNAFKI